MNGPDVGDLEDANERLEELLRFEQMLSEASSTFARTPLSHLDEVIDDALGRISRFLGAERGGLIQFDPESGHWEVTHRVHTADPGGVGPGVEERFPWLFGHLQRDELVVIRTLADWPHDAHAERAFCERIGLRSLIMIPLSIGGSVIGAITIESSGSSRTWIDQVIQRLRLLGEIIANALERQRAEDRATLHREQLSHMSRVTTLGELVAAISHELKQPLHSIVNNARAASNLLKATPPDLDDATAAMDDVVADGKRAATIIDRLRRLVRRETEHREPVDVSRLIEETLELVTHHAAMHDLTLASDLCSDLPAVFADPVQLQQVLMNLFSNASKAVREQPPGRREIVVSVGRQGEDIFVRVADRGRGLPSNAGEDIFKPFVTSGNEGLGMGLAISRTIIEAHGGRIRAEPNPGGGAVFQFTLPLDGAQTQ